MAEGISGYACAKWAKGPSDPWMSSGDTKSENVIDVNVITEMKLGDASASELDGSPNACISSGDASSHLRSAKIVGTEVVVGNAWSDSICLAIGYSLV